MKKKDFIIVKEDTPGLRRSKKLKKIFYRDLNGEIITGKKKIKQIKAIKIPPIWKDVWIAPQDKMHILAYGFDKSGKKQYIYHPEWIKINDQNKFERVHQFGIHLPVLRNYVSTHLTAKDWSKKKVAALAVSILDRHYLRVGNKNYVATNGTYGISTLRIKHINQSEKDFKIIYKAKGGKKRKIKVGSKKLQKMLLAISEIPGNRIFQYIGKSDQLYSLTSASLNKYIRTFSKGKFTAKDFRTWGATSLAVKYYKPALKLCQQNNRVKLETTIVKMVAKRLGNKMATSRDYYIHPKVLHILKNKELQQFKNIKLSPEIKYKNRLKKYEKTTLKILNTI